MYWKRTFELNCLSFNFALMPYYNSNLPLLFEWLLVQTIVMIDPLSIEYSLGFPRTHMTYVTDFDSYWKLFKPIFQKEEFQVEVTSLEWKNIQIKWIVEGLMNMNSLKAKITRGIRYIHFSESPCFFTVQVYTKTWFVPFHYLFTFMHLYVI